MKNPSCFIENQRDLIVRDATRSHLQQSTAIDYKNCVDELKKFLKNPPITRISQSDMTRYQEFLAKKGNTPRTIDKKIGTVRALFNFAKKHGYTKQENPAQNRSLLTKKQKLKGGYAIFELEEIEGLLSSDFFKDQQTKDPDYTSAIIICLITGCRIGEITNLKKSQFKKSASGINYLVIRDAKTQAGIREIPLHPDGFKYFSDFIDKKPEKIFKYSEREGKGTGNAVGKKFARNLESAKIIREKLVFHSLRKFVNNELLKNKVSLEARCQFIGHEIDNVNVSVYSNALNVDSLAETVFPAFRNIIRTLDKTVGKLENIDLSSGNF